MGPAYSRLADVIGTCELLAILRIDLAIYTWEFGILRATNLALCA
jgi:hypothetical protein